MIQTIKQVGLKGAGSEQAAEAVAKLSKLGLIALPSLLEGLDGASPLAANWLRASIDSVVENAKTQGEKLPTADLEEFIKETKHSPRGRRLAYELLLSSDPTAAERLLPGCLTDRSVELRRDAVAMVLAQAAKAKDETARALYEKALAAAVDDDQVKKASTKVRELGGIVDLAKHYGLITQWKIAGPFDNTGEKGFAIAYPPEKEAETGTMFSATYPGKQKEKPLAWFDYEVPAAKDPTDLAAAGKVDLNKAIGVQKGAIAYCVTEYESKTAQPVQLRVTSLNAIKLWVNGKLVDQRNVYHSGSSFDQYISAATLKPGKNTILIKVCQNEQTESWAGDWDFKLRVCDEAGGAIR